MPEWGRGCGDEGMDECKKEREGGGSGEGRKGVVSLTMGIRMWPVRVSWCGSFEEAGRTGWGGID